jgi:hypothetical protein
MSVFQLPLHRVEDGVYEAGGASVIYTHGPSKEVRLLKADEIVRCVNAHDKLVQAIRKLRRGDLPELEQPLWDELQAALAACEEPAP